MGQFSSWSICFRHANNTPIQDYVDKVNDFIKTSGEIKSIFDHFDVSYNADFKEADTEWETTSYSAQNNAENDLRVLSSAFPELIFHCTGNIDDGDPEFYINAQAGQLDWNWPEVAYSGFESIFYYDSDKPQPLPFTTGDIDLALSDMQTLRKMLYEKAGGPPPVLSIDTVIWALETVRKDHYKEGE